MKHLIISLIFLIPITLIAQKNDIGLSIESLVGYEYNISKNPNFYIHNGEEINPAELILSSPTQTTIVKLNFSKKKKKHLFIINTRLGYKLYSQYLALNKFNIRFNPEHQYKISKKTLLSTEVDLRYFHRNQLVNENELHSIPNPYYSIGIKTELQLKLSKYQKLNFSLGKRKKSYISKDAASLKYNELSSKVFFKQSFKNSKYISKAEISTKWRLRNYESISNGGNSIIDDELLDDNLNSTTDSNINKYKLNYLILKGAIKLKLNKNISLKTAIEWTNRTSANRKTLNYNQYRISADLAYKKDKTKLKLKTSYAYRLYPHSFPDNKEPEELLKYQYLNLGINWEQQLTKKLFLVTNIGLNKRVTNLDNDAIRTRRSYLYSYGNVGIRFNF